jgi:hypothetical protein
VETGASIARNAFTSGSTSRVVVDVREDDAPFLKASITLDVDDPAESRRLVNQRLFPQS